MFLENKQTKVSIFFPIFLFYLIKEREREKGHKCTVFGHLLSTEFKNMTKKKLYSPYFHPINVTKLILFLIEFGKLNYHNTHAHLHYNLLFSFSIKLYKHILKHLHINNIFK